MADPSENSIYKILVISDYRSISHTRAEAEVFVRLAEIGHTVHIMTYAHAEYNTRFRKHGLEVIEGHPEKKISLSFIRRLRKLVKANQYDFVHAFNSKGLTNAIWALTGLKTKLITYRGYAGQTYWYDPMMYIKYFNPRVDQIICVSKDIENILAKHMISGRRKLTTIPKGHDPQWYEDIEPVPRETLQIPMDAVLVCFLANNRPFKGFRYVVSATHLLSPDLPIHFLLVGLGYEDDETLQRIKDSPYADRFHKVGFQKNALPYLAACDSLISASTHGEGLSKSIVEAMSMGIAPIISDIGGNEGLLTDGESGWKVPVKDAEAIANALQDMATHKAERIRRGQNAQVHIQTHFNIRQSVEMFVAMYARMLS